MDAVRRGGRQGVRRRSGAAPPLVLRLLIEFLEDALAVSVGGAPRPADAEELRMLGELARPRVAGTLLAVIDRCLEADQQIERYVQRCCWWRRCWTRWAAS